MYPFQENLHLSPHLPVDAAGSNKQESFFSPSLLAISWKRQLKQRRTSLKQRRERVGKQNPTAFVALLSLGMRPGPEKRMVIEDCSFGRLLGIIPVCPSGSLAFA